jgi:hypothetical protein
MTQKSVLVKFSIIGMLISSFLIYIDQPTFGEYTFSFELDIWEHWNDKGADNDSFKYLIYVIGVNLCRIYLMVILFAKSKIDTHLIIYGVIYILICTYGFSLSAFLFFKYSSFFPHIFFWGVALILSKSKSLSKTL